jgi:hypothetical protein
MLRKIIFLCILGALPTACSGELPIITFTPQAVEQPATAVALTIENPAVATELPPTETEPPQTETTPIMVEPPERRAPQPINSEYLPQREDGNLTQGNVFIDRSELLIMESYPIQVALLLEGSLPTPCNQLRVVAKLLEEQSRIQVDVYSVTDPEQICAQVLEPFEVNIGLGSFPAGHYTVWVNGDQIGEFDA